MPEPLTPKPVRFSRAQSLFAVTLAVVLLWLVSQRVDGDEVWQTVRSLPGSRIAGTIALSVGIMAARSRRAQLLLVEPVPFTTLFRTVSASFVAAVLTPMRVGAMLRPVWLAAEGVAVGRTLMGMLVERIFDVFAVLILSLFAMTWGLSGIAIHEDFRELLDSARLLLGVAALGGIAGIALLYPCGGWMVARLRRGPGLFFDKLASALFHATQAIHEAAAHPRRVLEALGWTAVMWLGGLSVAALVLTGMAQTHAGAREIVVFWTGVMLANATVPTPGALGAYELAAILSLEPFGVSNGVALAAAMTCHATTLLTQSALGMASLVWMAKSGKRTR